MEKPVHLNPEEQPQSGEAVAREESRDSRREFLKCAIGAVVAAAAGSALSQPAPAQGTLGPAFANPAGVSSKGGKLRAVMELANDYTRSVPNVNNALQLRYFQGWDIDNPAVKAPDLTKSTAITAGPTLRAKVGDQVQIAFFNRIDDKKFPYTTVQENGKGQQGCDLTANPGLYPSADQFPNCFHGSSTANIHFHGTHTTPDGLGDNVLVQVMPVNNVDEKTYLSIFNTMFKSPPPQNWKSMPAQYQSMQQAAVTKIDKSLWDFDQRQINAGQWPQYIAGAFPNYFQIPQYTKGGPYQMGQAPGTHWYHAHKHGSTSLHILNGLAGAFIIEGDYDTFLRGFYGLGDSYPAAFEKIFVMQNITNQQNLELQRPNNARSGNATTLLNGLLTPVVQMRPNEVQLWRFVNATVGSFFNNGWLSADVFQTAGFQFKQTAMDGVQLSQKNYASQPFLSGKVPNTGPSAGGPPGLQLSAGNRCDVLVQAPGAPSSAPVPFLSNGKVLFYVSVTNDAPADPSVGKGFPSDWPAIPEFLNNLNAPQGYPHYVTFGWDAEAQRNTAGGGRLTSTSANLLSAAPRFTIDNKQFEQFGPTIDQCMPLNGLQDWVLENHTTIPHPFHIHINPFQVMEIDTPAVDASGGVSYTTYTPPTGTDPVWQDVIAIPPGVSVNNQVTPGRVRIRHQFVDYTGTYVLHCHILAHEDRGMMQLVRVVPSKQFPGSCQASIPAHH